MLYKTFLKHLKTFEITKIEAQDDATSIISQGDKINIKLNIIELINKVQ